jgi:O-antigen ligase
MHQLLQAVLMQRLTGPGCVIVPAVIQDRHAIGVVGQQTLYCTCVLILILHLSTAAAAAVAAVIAAGAAVIAAGAAVIAAGAAGPVIALLQAEHLMCGCMPRLLGLMSDRTVQYDS